MTKFLTAKRIHTTEDITNHKKKFFSDLFIMFRVLTKAEAIDPVVG